MTAAPSDSSAVQSGRSAAARESRIPVGKASLYARDIGRGQPMIVLHGGPDFDHAYLLPDLDRLADAFRLIYYDQRGRGRSAEGVQPDDVTLASDVDDVDKVRQHFQLESSALLGHSWGAVLALEYALRYPRRVSHLGRLSAPVFFIHAENDYSTAPGSALAAEMQRLGKAHALKIYPPFGADTRAGHNLVFRSVRTWEADVFAFLDAHLGSAR